MVNAAAIRTIAGIFGNVISFGLFVSPVQPTSIFRKDAGEGALTTYLVNILHGALWIYYGSMQPNNLLFLTMNWIGLVLGFIHLAMYLSKKRTLRVGGESVVAFSLCHVTLVAVLIINQFLNSKSWRDSAIGYLGNMCVYMNNYMHVPWDVLLGVYETKNPDQKSFWFSVFTFLNGVCWLAYTVLGLKEDYYLGVASCSVCVLSIIQLCYHAIYSLIRCAQSKKNQIHDEGELQV